MTSDWPPPFADEEDVRAMMPGAGALAMVVAETIVEEYRDELAIAVADRDVSLREIGPMFMCASVERAWKADPRLQELDRASLTTEQTVYLAERALVALRFAVYRLLEQEGRL
jgi:hypothetical protein